MRIRQDMSSDSPIQLEISDRQDCTSRLNKQPPWQIRPNTNKHLVRVPVSNTQTFDPDTFYEGRSPCFQKFLDPLHFDSASTKACMTASLRGGCRTCALSLGLRRPIGDAKGVRDVLLDGIGGRRQIGRRPCGVLRHNGELARRFGIFQRPSRGRRAERADIKPPAAVRCSCESPRRLWSARRSRRESRKRQTAPPVCARPHRRRRLGPALR
jgi:hypothetical protein